MRHFLDRRVHYDSVAINNAIKKLAVAAAVPSAAHLGAHAMRWFMATRYH